MNLDEMKSSVTGKTERKARCSKSKSTAESDMRTHAQAKKIEI